MIQNYIEAGSALTSEAGTALDILIFEDGTSKLIDQKYKFVSYFVSFLASLNGIELKDFEQRINVAEGAKQNLELVQRCLHRTGELAGEIVGSFTTMSSTDSGTTSLASSQSQILILTPQQKKPSRKTRGSVQADLSAARKQHEKAHLAKIIARQRQQQLEQEFHATKPKSVDLQFVSELISRRQNAHSSLNDRLLSLFENFANSIQMRADEDIWQRTLKLSFSTAPAGLEPISSVVGLMSHPSHPISRLVRDFVIRMRHLLSAEDCNQQGAGLLLPEYHQFCCQLMNLLKHNYAEELTDSSFEIQLYVSIESFFFAHLPSLSSSVFLHFRQLSQQADNELLRKCLDLAWIEFESELALYEVLGVRDKHRLLLDSFDHAIIELRKLPSLSTPTAKVNSLLRACDFICAALVEEAGEDSSLIGSEDLVLLLSYVIVRAQVSDLFAQFSFMGELLPEPLLRGQAGYVLATLQTCMDFISSIK